jgi:hypothetical protein
MVQHVPNEKLQQCKEAAELLTMHPVPQLARLADHIETTLELYLDTMNDPLL